MGVGAGAGAELWLELPVPHAAQGGPPGVGTTCPHTPSESTATHSHPPSLNRPLCLRRARCLACEMFASHSASGASPFSRRWRMCARPAAARPPVLCSDRSAWPWPQVTTSARLTAKVRRRSPAGLAQSRRVAGQRLTTRRLCQPWLPAPLSALVGVPLAKSRPWRFGRDGDVTGRGWPASRASTPTHRAPAPRPHAVG